MLPGAPAETPLLDWRVLAFVLAVTALTGREPGRQALRKLRPSRREVRQGAGSGAATVYVPYDQSRPSSAIIAVRRAGNFSSATGVLREVVRQIDPNLRLTDVSTQLAQVERRFQQEKVFAQAYTLFGVVALLVASIGLFGLMSYSVSRRTNEIGIRMALGAQRFDVLRQVLWESMLLVVIGVIIGMAVALGAGRLVATLRFGLAPNDVMTVAAGVAVMLVVSAVAGYLPARRAWRVDPMVALHYE